MGTNWAISVDNRSLLGDQMLGFFAIDALLSHDLRTNEEFLIGATDSCPMYKR